MHIFVAFLQVLCLYHEGICYFCVDNLFRTICLHVATQFRILQYRIINTPTLEDKDKLGQDSNHDSSDKFQEFISLIELNLKLESQTEITAQVDPLSSFSPFSIGTLRF